MAKTILRVYHNSMKVFCLFHVSETEEGVPFKVCKEGEGGYNT